MPLKIALTTPTHTKQIGTQSQKESLEENRNVRLSVILMSPVN